MTEARNLVDLLTAIDSLIKVGDLRAAHLKIRRAIVQAQQERVPEVQRQMIALLQAQARRVEKARQQSNPLLPKSPDEKRATRKLAKQAKAAEMLAARCASCHVSGTETVLTDKSGKPRCAPCFHAWANQRCTRCGNAFLRHSASPRQKVCDSCGPGRGSKSVRTVSGGLPTLGKRR